MHRARKLNTAELNRPSPSEYRQTAKVEIVLVLDNVRSGLNVGSIFRSADAFAITQVICCGYTPAPPHRDVLKTALGSTETVSWRAEKDVVKCVKDLTALGYACYAVEQTTCSISLDDFRATPGRRLALVVGNEVSGVQQSVIDCCHGCIEVEQFGTKHSLNVAVCAGIVLYRLRQIISSHV